MKFGVEGITG